GGRVPARAVVGVAVGAVGIVATSIGTYFGVRAASDQSDANVRCPEQGCSDPDAVALSQSAGRSADAASVLIPIGLVAVTAGIVLYVTAPRRAAAAPRSAIVRW